MTVSRHKRRVSTTRALGLAIAGLALALVLGVVGGVAIYNTKDGEAQGNSAPVDRFPDTPTGMVAVVDGLGNLGSVAVFAVRPPDESGAARGGSVVVLPVSADVSGGFGDERIPLAQLTTTYGTDALADDVSALLGLAIDAPLVVTVEELGAMLGSLGPLAVDLPEGVVGRDGSELAAAGAQTLDPPTAAAVLGASSDVAPGTSTARADLAIWRAIAAAVGAGLPEPLALPDGTPTPTVTAFAELLSGPVGVSAVGSRALSDLAVNPSGVDAVALDRAEVVTIFGHIAPSRVAAPNTGYTALVRSPFADDQLDGLTRYDVAYAATGALLGVDANVLSVDTTADEAGEQTVIEVADESMVTSAERLADVFGDVDVRVAERRVAGVNLIITLGTAYLPIVESTTRPSGAASATSTAPTAPATEETS